MEKDIDMRQAIEKAAKEYLSQFPWEGGDKLASHICEFDFKAGFKAGAEWQARQSPWNDTTEKPVQGKLCLVEYKDPDGEIRVRLDKHCGMEWKEMCHYDKILRWAYVEDLLRKGGIE